MMPSKMCLVKGDSIHCVLYNHLSEAYNDSLQGIGENFANEYDY